MFKMGRCFFSSMADIGICHFFSLAFFLLYVLPIFLSGISIWDILYHLWIKARMNGGTIMTDSFQNMNVNECKYEHYRTPTASHWRVNYRTLNQ